MQRPDTGVLRPGQEAEDSGMATDQPTAADSCSAGSSDSRSDDLGASDL